MCVCACVLDMRKIGSSRGAVTAYPRQLESLIRLAEAHAKMRSIHNNRVCLCLCGIFLSLFAVGFQVLSRLWM